MTAVGVEPDTLTNTCAQIRSDIVRMCAGPEGGHIGGSMSSVEALVALYFEHMTVHPEEPRHPKRDVMIMSKGHASLAHYAVLARRGYFPTADLDSYTQRGSALSPHANPRVPGIEGATGSLGHGLGLGLGFALARRLSGESSRVFILLGDGELQEGSCWEAVQVASALNLGNVVALVDANEGQQSGMVRDISNLEPLGAKWAAFGWRVIEVDDGNDVERVSTALGEATRDDPSRQPTVVILRTVKAKGVPMLAGKPGSHFVTLDARRLAQVQSSMADQTEGGSRD